MHALIFLLFAGLLHASNAFVVVIDPGHGGIDHGAVRENHKESQITLNVARELEEKLKKDRRFKVHMTRSEDQTLSLSDRSRMARDRRADVFLSVHVNSNPNSKARGAEFYFQNQLPPDQESMYRAHRENSTEEALGLALTYPFIDSAKLPGDVASIVTDLLDSERILRSSQLTKFLKANWRGSKKTRNNSVRQAPFFVLSQMTTPSALVELGFLTNPEEMRELVRADVQKRMAEDLYRGLVAYKESMDKVRALP